MLNGILYLVLRTISIHLRQLSPLNGFCLHSVSKSVQFLRNISRDVSGHCVKRLSHVLKKENTDEKGNDNVYLISNFFNMDSKAKVVLTTLCARSRISVITETLIRELARSAKQ